MKLKLPQGAGITTLLITSVLLSACGGDNSAKSTQANLPHSGPPSASSNSAEVSFSGPRNNYTITRTVTGFTVTDNIGKDGTTSYTGASLFNFSDVTVNLLVGDKSKTIPAAQLKSLLELYVAFFNRVPDAEGMAYWIDQIKAGTTIEQLSNNFYTAAIQYSSVTGYSTTMSNADFIKVIYKNVLGRDTVDQEGMDYWSAALAKPAGSPGAETRGTLINSIIGSAHSFKGDVQYGWVADLLDNKLTVGSYFAIEQGLTYLTAEDSISKGIAIAKAVTATDISASKLLIGVNDKQLNLTSGTPGINSVIAKALTVLPNAISIPVTPIGAIPKAPLNLAAAPAGSNFKIWIYDPRNTNIKLASDVIFLALAGGDFNAYPVNADGTINLQLGFGKFDFDVVEPNGTSSLFTRARYQGEVASGGPAIPSANPPGIPGNLSPAPAGSNFKLWIYDPRNPALALPTVIFLLSPDNKWTKISSQPDGSLYLPLAAGQYSIDVAEPNPSIFKRRRYDMSVSATGVASIVGITPNAQGILPVTVDLQDLPGALTIKGVVPNANGVYAVTVDTITPVPVPVQQKRDNLISFANDSAYNFKPTSACQLIDQVTPVRTINSPEISAGFPRVKWRLPSYGHIRALIIPVDFDEVVGVDSVPAFITPIANNVRDFYLSQSYGRLSIDFEVLPNWLRAPFPVSDYFGATPQDSSPDTYARAIIKLTDNLIDYGQYDTVYFVVPKQMPFSKMAGTVGITHPIWTRTGYITNGAIITADAYLPQNGVGADWKVIAHESGHTFGLYDEDLDHSSQTLGSWSLMANSWSSNAIEHNGWDRYLLGWLNESQAACLPRTDLTAAGAMVKLNPLERQNTETKVAMVPLSASKILVMESRKSEGYDHVVPEREGVLAYTVDMKLGQLKGGYQTQRRPGSTDPWFEDAALRAGDTITVDGVTVTVVELNPNGDTIKISVK
jgi:M6 family metalloprotease-like protein